MVEVDFFLVVEVLVVEELMIVAATAGETILLYSIVDY